MSVISAILEVTGCCNNYRAEMVINLGESQFITITARGRSAVRAHQSLLSVAEHLNLPGFDPKSAKVKQWTNK